MLCFPFGRPGEGAARWPLWRPLSRCGIYSGVPAMRARRALSPRRPRAALRRGRGPTGRSHGAGLMRPPIGLLWLPHTTRAALTGLRKSRAKVAPANHHAHGASREGGIPNRSSRPANAWPQSCWKRPTLRLSTAILPPRSIGDREASAPASSSRGPGNGILRAETGGRIQARTAGERSEFGSQTPLRLTNPPELRGLL